MNKRRLIYILSPSYSGSTLLTMLMAQHPSISTIGELKATSMGDLDVYYCSCGSLIRECPFWESLNKSLNKLESELNLADFGTHFSSKNKVFNKILGAQVRSNAFEIVRNSLIRSVIPLNRQFNKILNKNMEMIEAICELQAGSIFLDGSKDPHRLLYLYNSGLWDISVIKMVRDGRAQSNSNRLKEISNMNYEQSAIEWNKTIQQMNNVCRYIPSENIHELKYEDLCADPNLEMESIWKFLSVENIDKNWEQINIKEFEHHILGNSMRTKEKIYISLDDGWKMKVTDKENKVFDKVAGETNRSFGYE